MAKKTIKKSPEAAKPKTNYLEGKTKFTQPKQMLQLQQFLMLNYGYHFSVDELAQVWSDYEAANGGSSIQITEDGMQFIWVWLTQP